MTALQVATTYLALFHPSQITVSLSTFSSAHYEMLIISWLKSRVFSVNPYNVLYAHKYTCLYRLGIHYYTFQHFALCFYRLRSYSWIADWREIKTRFITRADVSTSYGLSKKNSWRCVHRQEAATYPCWICRTTQENMRCRVRSQCQPTRCPRYHQIISLRQQ